MAHEDNARRIVNLLFTLNASRAPLTTEQILSDTDLGYGSPNRASEAKKFHRDREKLANMGVVIREVRARGAAENEESAWTIDRAATHAVAGLVSEEDAEALVDVIEGLLQRGDIPYRPALRRLRAKLLEAAGGLELTGGEALPQEPSNPVLDAIWGAYAARKRLMFTYRNAAGGESKRTVAVYGLFSQDGRSYFVGEDGESGTVRTFRADRVERVWRPSGSIYEIPEGFSVERYLFLPFDFSNEPGVEALFSFPDGATRGEIEAIAHGHGRIERAEDGWRWRVEVRDISAAAAFALARAHLGMRPLAPRELRDAWTSLIERSVDAHA